MDPLLIFLIIAVAFWSVTTTFRAIYLILTKNFTGNKVSWILISLIAVIGPILWVTKGKKMIKR